MGQMEFLEKIGLLGNGFEQGGGEKELLGNQDDTKMKNRLGWGLVQMFL